MLYEQIFIIYTNLFNKFNQNITNEINFWHVVGKKEKTMWLMILSENLVFLQFPTENSWVFVWYHSELCISPHCHACSYVSCIPYAHTSLILSVSSCLWSLECTEGSKEFKNACLNFNNFSIFKFNLSLHTIIIFYIL